MRRKRIEYKNLKENGAGLRMTAEKRGQKIREILGRVGKDLRGALAVAAAFLIYYLMIHSIFDAFCPFLVATGIPCAGCGLTRATIYLLKGQVRRAALINPSIFPVLAFAVYCGYFRYVRGSAIRGLKIALAILVTGMLAVYTVRMIMYFPGQAPYIYQSDNLFAAWIPGYREWMQRLVRGITLWRRGG